MRRYTRNERKLRRTILLTLLAVLCTISVAVAVSLDNSDEDPTRDLPLKTTVIVPEPVRNGMDVLGEFAIVAYCSCQKCCGDYALDRPLDENGKEIVYTASGEVAEAGVTVAVDPDIIPLGTEVYINGLGWYKAQDTGAFNGKVVDVYFDSHEAACEFGRRDATVAIREVAVDG